MKKERKKNSLMTLFDGLMFIYFCILILLTSSTKYGVSLGWCVPDVVNLVPYMRTIRKDRF